MKKIIINTLAGAIAAWLILSILNGIIIYYKKESFDFSDSSNYYPVVPMLVTAIVIFLFQLRKLRKQK